MRSLISMAVIASPLACAPVSAPAPEHPLAGIWDAELTVDSAQAVLHEGGERRIFRFDPETYCGGATLGYIYASGQSDTAHVTYRVRSDTLEFGGTVARVRSADGSTAQRCRISGDDGSLFGEGFIAGDSIVGRWGRATFGSTGLIGTYVARRR